MDGEAKCVLEAKAELGEGPVWEHREGVLWWVDIDGRQIHRFDPVSGKDRAITLEEKVGAAVPREQGGLVAALASGFASVNPKDGTVTPLAKPDAEPAENRFNDGKCDPAGRFWAGTMGRQGTGTLYRLDVDHSLQAMVPEVTVSNGLAWSADGSTMYYIDTATGQVDAFDYDLHSGAIGQRRRVVAIPREQGYPDGMSIDEEGKLWVAHWGGWQIGRWDPHTGQKLGQIKVPAAHVTSCAFGGPHGTTLYITTARGGLDEAALAKQPLAGGLFAIELTVRGPAAVLYGG